MGRLEPASLNRTENFVRFQGPPAERSDGFSRKCAILFRTSHPAAARFRRSFRISVCKTSLKSNESGWKRPNETFFIKEKGFDVHGSGAHWLHTVHRSRLCVGLRTLYSVANSTTRIWAHLTSKHPQSPQKMGEGDYGRIPKGFVLFLILGRRAHHPMIFHIFQYFFYHRFLISN